MRRYRIFESESTPGRWFVAHPPYTGTDEIADVFPSYDHAELEAFERTLAAIRAEGKADEHCFGGSSFEDFYSGRIRYLKWQLGLQPKEP